jgi:dihydrofolate synthase / folylpolyglutamate synthase
MTYEETLDYLYKQLPMFHRIGAAAYKADLKNTLEICELLNHPERKFKSIHIAGTNGKGSTSHMLAAILQTAGYKTGLYTSPHLKDFRERIRINGKMIEQSRVTEFVVHYQTAFEKIQPSFFEWTVGLAFDYFAKEKVDIAIIETGLGGRLDSTNVITPLLSVITNIGWDHTNLLGSTLEQIAGEKAGIIKQNIFVIIGETQQTVQSVFTNKARECNADILFADSKWKAEEVSRDDNYLSLNVYQNSILRYPNLKLDLTANYQKKNILTVLESIELIKTKGFHIEDNHVYSALQNVKSLTGLQGRWQKLSDSPPTYCDVAHNKDGIHEVIEQIMRTHHHHLHFVLGMVNDKDVSGVLSLLPNNATYYFCKADIPRAMDAEELKHKAAEHHLSGKEFASVKEALRAAQSNADENDLVFVGGSTFVVAEVL